MFHDYTKNTAQGDLLSQQSIMQKIIRKTIFKEGWAAQWARKSQNKIHQSEMFGTKLIVADVWTPGPASIDHETAPQQSGTMFARNSHSYSA